MVVHGFQYFLVYDDRVPLAQGCYKLLHPLFLKVLNDFLRNVSPFGRPLFLYSAHIADIWISGRCLGFYVFDLEDQLVCSRQPDNRKRSIVRYRI